MASNAPSIYHLCMFEKGKGATWQKGTTRWKICRPSDVFFRKPCENIDATASVTTGCKCLQNQFSQTSYIQDLFIASFDLHYCNESKTELHISLPGRALQIVFNFNPFPSKWVLRALIDFTLSNARRFYSSMGNLSDRKGLTTSKTMSLLNSV